MDGGTVLIVILVLLTISGLSFRRALKLKKEKKPHSERTEINTSLQKKTTASSHGFIGPNASSKLKTWDKNVDELWRGSIEIEFDYINTKKITSTRKVVINKLIISEKSDLLFRGFCLLRQTNRTFLVQSIASHLRYDNRLIDPFLFIEEVLGIVIDAKDLIKTLPSIHEMPGSIRASSKLNEPWPTLITPDDFKHAIEDSLAKFKTEIDDIKSDKIDIAFNGSQLELYKCFKNGNRYKQPTVTVFYNEKNTSRKWSVSTQDGKESFALIDDAIQKLIVFGHDMKST